MSARERLLHPAAWWLWGLGLATAASRTTNPMVLLLIIGVCILVVSERRDPSAPNPLMAFVVIGAMVVVFRLVMTVILGNGIRGETVLFTLPRIPLPEWASFLRIGGRCRWRACSTPSMTRCASRRSSRASAPPTRWPARGVCCGTCQRRCTTSARPLSSA